MRKVDRVKLVGAVRLGLTLTCGSDIGRFSNSSLFDKKMVVQCVRMFGGGYGHVFDSIECLDVVVWLRMWLKNT